MPEHYASYNDDGRRERWWNDIRRVHPNPRVWEAHSRHYEDRQEMDDAMKYYGGTDAQAQKSNSLSEKVSLLAMCSPIASYGHGMPR
jgi:hypothetical protein